MKRWFWLLPLLCLATPVFAVVSLFNIPSTDQSYLFLMQLFGQVGGLMPGARLGQNPLKDALYYFNNVVMIAGGVVVLYTTVVATINTAHDGEMLGRNWKSVWIPIRTALGFALLLPVSGGYSVIQAFVMWVVLQGVGAADYIWFKYADGIAKGAYLTTTNTAFQDAGSTTIDVPTNAIFNNLVCANLGKMMLGTSGDVIETTLTSYNFTIPSLPSGACGSVARVSDLKVDQALKSYIDQINNSAAVPYSQIQYNTYVEASDNPPNYPGDTQIQAALQRAAWQYTSDITQLAKDAGLENNKNENYTHYVNLFKSQANADGWIYAGSLYMLILKIQSTAPSAKSTAGKALINTATPTVTPLDPTKINLGDQNNAVFGKLLDNAQNFTDNIRYETSQPGSFILKCQAMKTNTRAKQVMLDLGNDCSVVTGAWSKVINPGDIMGSKTGKQSTPNYTPMVNLAQWGQDTIQKIMTLWIVLLAVITAAGAVMGGISFIPFVGAFAQVAMTTIATLIAFLTPLLAFVMSIYWMNGTMAGYYLPLLPYIIFTTTVVGWFLLVIEAMVAAPLMALGILHPEGRHDILGSAQQGFEILFGAFLRPMLMIVGFIAAGLVVTIVIELVNTGFYIAIFQMFSSNKLVSLWTSLILQIIYLTTIVTLVSRAFTLIYQIPDQVMRWLGLSGERTAADDISAIRQATDRGAEQGLGAVKGTAAATGPGSQIAPSMVDAGKRLKADKKRWFG